MSGEKYCMEIPEAIQAAAERNVQQMRLAFDGFMSAARRNAVLIEWRSTGLRSGTKEVLQKAIGFAEANVTTSLELAHRLVQAKSIVEVVEMQWAFAQSQTRVVAEQAAEIGRTVAGMANNDSEPKK